MLRFFAGAPSPFLFSASRFAGEIALARFRAANLLIKCEITPPPLNYVKLLIFMIFEAIFCKKPEMPAIIPGGAVRTRATQNTGKRSAASREHNITLASPIVPNEAVRHFPVASAHDLPVRAALPAYIRGTKNNWLYNSYISCNKAKKAAQSGADCAAEILNEQDSLFHIGIDAPLLVGEAFVVIVAPHGVGLGCVEELLSLVGILFED